MKARPRSVERKVASYLSEIFVSHGLSVVERTPITGRTGPDIEINESKLVIDVKSRLQVPKTLWMRYDYFNFMCFQTEVMCLELRHLRNSEAWFDAEFPVQPYRLKCVTDWFTHMDEWTQAQVAKSKMPFGITALVLHRPGENISQAKFIIRADDRRRLNWLLT